MKTVFIEARKNIKPNLDKVLPELKSLGDITLATTVQYLDYSKAIKDNLDSVSAVKGIHSKYDMQILGCDALKINIDKPVLYIGDGLFHPKALLLNSKHPVYVLNPESEEISKLTKEDIANIEKKRKAGLTKFHSSNNIGVLITLKPGQYNPKAFELKNKYSDKNIFYLLTNTINFDSLEDFNFVECFVNTACPRISYDDSIRLPKPVVDISEI